MCLFPWRLVQSYFVHFKFFFYVSVMDVYISMEWAIHHITDFTNCLITLPLGLWVCDEMLSWTHMFPSFVFYFENIVSFLTEKETWKNAFWRLLFVNNEDWWFFPSLSSSLPNISHRYCFRCLKKWPCFDDIFPVRSCRFVLQFSLIDKENM